MLEVRDTKGVSSQLMAGEAGKHHLHNQWCQMALEILLPFCIAPSPLVGVYILHEQAPSHSAKVVDQEGASSVKQYYLKFITKKWWSSRLLRRMEEEQNGNLVLLLVCVLIK